ncbi:MAG: hypothetical protein ACOYMR_07595 [Ilumatobacteraceae bacterium]
METLVDTVVDSTSSTERSGGAAFLAVLEAEQTRYLDAIGRARAALGLDATHLAEMSAVQGRLTRRFFDAQRAILRQRSEADDALGSMLDGMTFVGPNNIDHGRFERQLDALLDEWWQAEQRSCVGLVAETPQVEAVEDRSSTAAPLPLSLVDALTSADPADLDRILDDLVADFTTHAAVAAAARTVEAPKAPARSFVPFAPPSEDDLAIKGDTLDDFELFWAPEGEPAPVVVQDAAEPTAPSLWSQVPTGIVLPIAGVTAGLALVMALVG